MTEREFCNALNRSLNQELSPEVRARILTRVRGKEPIMKKKLSAGLIFAFALVLLATAALAVSLRGYLETAAQLQQQSGYYDDWRLEDKRKLLEAMVSHGLLSAEEAAGLTEEAAVDRFFISRYGADGRSDPIGLTGILETELGEIDTWPQETKAWYSQLLSGLGLLSDDEEIYLPLSEADVSPEEAVEAARRAAEEAWGLDAHALDGCAVTWDLRMQEGVAHYRVALRTDAVSCTVAVGPDGHVLSSADGPLFLSPGEQRAQSEAESVQRRVAELIADYSREHGIAGSWYFASVEDQYAIDQLIRPVLEEAMAAHPQLVSAQDQYLLANPYGLPQENAITGETAVSLARAAAAQAAGVPESLFDSQTVICHYVVADPEYPVWKIVLSPTDEGRERQLTRWLVRIDALSGEVLQTIGSDAYLEQFETIDGFLY